MTGLTATASVVIASTTAGRLVSIDAMSGSIRWLYPMRAPLEHAVCLTGSLVHAASSDGILYTLDVGTGRPRWAFQLDQTPTVHPVAVGTSLVALATSGLIGLDRSSGEQLWVAELDHPVERLRGGRSHGVASNPTGIQMLDAFGALTAVPGAVDAIQVGDHVAIAAADRVVWWTPETRSNAPG